MGIGTSLPGEHLRRPRKKRARSDGSRSGAVDGLREKLKEREMQRPRGAKDDVLSFRRATIQVIIEECAY